MEKRTESIRIRMPTVVDEVKIREALHCLVQAAYETDPVEVLRWLKECRRVVNELIKEGHHDRSYDQKTEILD